MRFLFVLLSLLTLAACTTGNNPAGAPVPQLTFENAQAVPIRVAMLEMLDRSASKRSTDDRSQDFITPPVTALERYFRQRYSPSGFEGSLQVIVEQAGVLVSEKPKEEGLLTKLTDWNRQDVYTISMQVLLRASNGAATELKLHQQEVMPVNPSLAEREKFLQAMMEKVIADLDVATLRAMNGTLNILAVPLETVRPVAQDQEPVMLSAPQPQPGAPVALNAPQPAYAPQPVVDDPYGWEVSPTPQTVESAPGVSDNNVVEPLSSPEGWGQQYQ